VDPKHDQDTAEGSRIRQGRRRHIPGSYVETGQTPAPVAAREVREELDFQAPVGPCSSRAGHRTPRRAKLLVIFDSGTLTAGQLDGIRLQDYELASYALRDPTEAIPLLIPPWSPGSRRTRCAPRRGTYLECGIPHVR
jgi:hypothetical protein